ncbi:MAG: hypothetical protein Q9175_008146, partial [Cornicularia normoerica]
QATEVISSLTNQTAYFAYVLCMEKDFMTTVLRTFVDALLMIIKSDPTRVNPVAFMVWPWGHPLRLLNRQWQSPWFPKPRLYAFEADAEMRFQKQQLTGRFNEALGKISASFPTIQTSKTQLLKGATSVVTIQLKKLQQIIHESDSSRWPWDPKSQETSTLQEVYKLLTDSRNHLLKVLDTIALYEIMLTRLWNDLRPLRTVSCSSCQSKFSPTGSLTVPESLLMQVQNIPFVSLRSAIAELCKVGNVVDIPNDNLYTICTIYTLAATMSGLDDDALSRKRRSWMVELKTVTTEFGQQEGFDLGVVRNSLEGLASKAKGIDYYDRRLEHEDL